MTTAATAGLVVIVALSLLTIGAEEARHGDTLMMGAVTVSSLLVAGAWCVRWRRGGRPAVAGLEDLWRRAPGPGFHALLVLPTVLLLFSVSVPAGTLLAWLVAAAALTALAALWVLRCVTYALAAAKGRHHGSVLPFLVAPIGGAVVLGLLAVDAPFRLRWEASVADLDAFVASASSRAPRVIDGTPESGPRDLPAPVWVGAFRVQSAHATGDAVRLYMGSAGVFCEAGFAHLPAGPDRGSSTDYDHIEGDWYLFTACW